MKFNAMPAGFYASAKHSLTLNEFAVMILAALMAMDDLKQDCLFYEAYPDLDPLFEFSFLFGMYMQMLHDASLTPYFQTICDPVSSDGKFHIRLLSKKNDLLLHDLNECYDEGDIIRAYTIPQGELARTAGIAFAFCFSDDDSLFGCDFKYRDHKDQYKDEAVFEEYDKLIRLFEQSNAYRTPQQEITLLSLISQSVEDLKFTEDDRVKVTIKRANILIPIVPIQPAPAKNISKAMN
jgi:hypothetical protein